MNFKKYTRVLTVSAIPMSEGEAEQKFLIPETLNKNKYKNEGYFIMEELPNGKKIRQWMMKGDFEEVFKSAADKYSYDVEKK